MALRASTPAFAHAIVKVAVRTSVWYDTRVMSPFIESLSPYLFWDTDREQVDPEKHRSHIVQRVVERGSFEDWKRLRDHYGLDGVVSAAQSLRTLEPTALSFLSTVGNVPKESFRCSTSKPWLPPL